jgi:hypothetical protein
LPQAWLRPPITGEGVLTFTTGANAGLSQKVRSHAAGGVVTLVLPMVMAGRWATSSPSWPAAASA